MTNNNLPPLIPRKILFDNPTRTSPQISRDGKYLAYIAPDDKNVLQVWLQTLGEEQEEPRRLTNDKKRGIRSYFWTYNPEQLIYLQDTDGDEDFHLYSVNIQTNLVRDLTPFEGVKAQVIDLDHHFPDTILVGLNINDRQKFDVYRLNLQTGAVEFDTENPGNIVDWTANSKFEILVALAATEDAGYDLLYRPTVESAWELLRHWSSEDQGGAVGFAEDENILYIIGSHDANAQRLLALDLTTKAETIIAEDREYDLSNILFHTRERRIQAISFYKEKAEWQILDEEIAPDFAALKEVRPGQYSIISRDLDNENWIVGYLTDDGPVYYYFYNRKSKSATLLFSNKPELEDLPLVPMKPITYAARDGLTIHGYLTLPMGGEAPLPCVLLVHGGPWARNTWGYNSMVQWLANRGYGVLQVNFRGSSGYGKDFLNAGNCQWGKTMHDDLIDAVNWLVEEGIGDRSKIAIMGGSYGGYATLAGLTFTPDTFACGVDIVGPSNLMTLIDSVPPYWKPMMAMFQHRIGARENEDFLKSRSPLFFVDKIEKPLLIGQGANDPRVKQAESEQIVAAMEKAGKPVEYALYTDEGHGFARPENRLHFYALTEEFFGRYLGGQFEPVGEIEGHSGIVTKK